MNQLKLTGRCVRANFLEALKRQSHCLPGACLIVIFTLALAAIGTAGFPQNAWAVAPGKEVHVEAQLIADTSAIQPAEPFHLGILLKMQPGWHTYYKNPGDAGMPTKIDWQVPPGFSVKSLTWEKPSRFDEGGIITYGYAGETLIAAQVTPPSNLPASKSVTFKANVTWLSCHDICVPGGTTVEFSLPVATISPITHPNLDAFAKSNFDGPITEITQGGEATGSGSAKGGDILSRNLTLNDGSAKSISLLGYLGLALVGGMILNFMPCVLPVVAIKVLSLLEQANEDHAKVRLLGLTFSAGIMSSFLALAAVVISIQAAGRNIGWGFQFQYPPFVIVMAMIVLVFALSLFGMLNLSVSVGQGEVGQLAEKEGFIGTFFKGVLATILSTPCTAPFLGTALGFAFTQPWWVIASIFFTVGLGMSLPYLLLTINPAWMKYLPRPGLWMEKLKEFFGFVLIATVAWLTSILGGQIGVEGQSRAVYLLVAVALAVWVINRFSNLASSMQRTIVVRSIASAIVLGALGLFIMSDPGLFAIGAAPAQSSPTALQASPSDSGSWQPFSLNALNDSLNSGKTVMVDFTAKWCLTCQVNEGAVLHTKPIEDKLKALNVVQLKADWTNQDPTITQLLKKFGRSGVPLYVIFPAKSPDHPIVLPEIITADLVLAKLDEAGPSLETKK